jgi:trans-2,3-dihydro-3-hydroxyanthranilate isomerase
MQYMYYMVDVFTDQIFNGAQIAVFPQADGLTKDQMQLLAREINFSETVFVFPHRNGSSDRRIRVFAPHKELDFAGHPIIAAGHVLAAVGNIELTGEHTNLQFEQNIGPVDVSITQSNGQPVLTQFSLQTKPRIDRFTPEKSQLADILSLKPEDLESKFFHPLIVFSDQSYLIVPIRSYAKVRDAKFDHKAWSRSTAPSSMAASILLFTTQSDVHGSDFHARLVGPEIGVKEDPPVGSVMPAFAAYLCAHEHVATGTHAFVIDRGNVITRKSVLNIEMDNRHEPTLTVRVGGPAVLVGEGTITVPPR